MPSLVIGTDDTGVKVMTVPDINPLAIVNVGFSPGASSSVTVDGDTILGDGSGGDPLTLDGGIGAPRWVQFSQRNSHSGNDTVYFTLGLIGSLGSGGQSGLDPTDPLTGSIRFAAPYEKGEFSDFYIDARGEGGPGLGESVEFSIQVDAATSALSVTLADAEETGSDTVNAASVSEGGLVAIKAVNTSGANDFGFTGRVRFTPKP